MNCYKVSLTALNTCSPECNFDVFVQAVDEKGAIQVIAQKYPQDPKDIRIVIKNITQCSQDEFDKEMGRQVRVIEFNQRRTQWAKMLQECYKVKDNE